jgi:hypothetical protein
MADEIDMKAAATSLDRKFLIIGLPILIVTLLAMAFITISFNNSLAPGEEKDAFGDASMTNGIHAQATINNVDPTKAEVTVRLAMTPVGSLVDSSGLLTKPVTLYYDSIDGTKQIDFKAGKPLGSTDLTVPLLDGTISSYPWDKYTGDISLTFVTVSGTSTGAQTPEPTSAPAATKSAEPKPDTIVPATMSVFENVPAYNMIDVNGSANADGVLDVHLNVSRNSATLFFSGVVTLVMWALALGVFFIALSVVIRRRKFELAQITMMAAILFALPAALRGSQPGIPPPGVMCDYYGFFFCDVIVALSLITVITMYVKRATPTAPQLT